MNHPTADDDYSPRKIWLEIDSQILSALFCVTGFGFAPWRFCDFYWMAKVVHLHDKPSMARLMQQNKAWFRPLAEYDEPESVKVTITFTGRRAPPTPLWKLAFMVDMMMLNTALQAVLCYFKWGYNRFDRPTWATGKFQNHPLILMSDLSNYSTGTFNALGCGSAALAGLMSW
tara:strand:- start:274 stop:792 length:519 start_codon:yes stop_codon:yes gene_type:complete